MEIITILCLIYSLVIGILTYLIVKEKNVFLIFLFIILLVITVSILGFFVGTRTGESNVLKGKPTYKMVINYQKIDNVVSVKDTTFILKK